MFYFFPQRLFLQSLDLAPYMGVGGGHGAALADLN